MTNQQIFDEVATHLLTQKVKSGNKSFCYYRSPEGLKCAVGCLISDAAYTKEMESFQVRSAIVDDCLKKSLGRSASRNLRLLTDLQEIHDQFDPEFWAANLQRIGRKFHLSTKALKPFMVKP